MTITKLSSYLNKLEKTSSRNDITQILAELLAKSSTEEIDKTVCLILGTLAPSYKNIVFNLADKLMAEALALAYEVDRADVHQLNKTKGDLGATASELSQKGKNSGNGLSVEKVYERLVEIANFEGEGSQEMKVSKLASLLKELDSESAKYVTRIVVGKLRLGFSEKTIIDALSWMERGDKTGKAGLEKAFFVLPDIGLLAKKVKEQGVEKTSTDLKPVVGIPVQPMLAQRLKSPTDMIKKMGTVAVEPKLDGLRLLIHYKKNDFVKAFTRNLNEVTWMFPELQKIGSQLDASEVILDVEAIGMDEERKGLADFQTTMQRRRKHEVADFSSKIPITFYAFDLLLRDNENLMSENYENRRSALNALVKDGKYIQIVRSTITDSPEEIANLQKEAINEGLEGVMVKKVNSEYIPGRTGWRWVKMKEAELATGKLSDTVDAVIMGYTLGRGKRAAFGIGQFLAGVIDGDKIKSITKVGTGLSDDDFKELSKRLKKIEVKDKPVEYLVHKDLEPDFWVLPEVLVELAADDLTRSPKHTAGYALRFPRLVKFRDDKSAKEATTVKEINNLYKLQFSSK